MAELKGKHLVLIVIGTLAAMCILAGLTVGLYIALMQQMISGSMRQNAARFDRIEAEAELLSMGVAILSFQTDVGRYPQTLDELDTPPEGVEGWSGPYLGTDLLDPWGNRYVYRLTEDGERPYELRSLGADGLEGGEGEDADVIQGKP